MSRQRVFFAARPPKPVLLKIEHVADACVCGPTRRVATPALHLTLCFLGSLEPEQIRRAIEVANELAHAPIELVFKRCEYRRRQQMIWLRAGPSESLTHFVAELCARLEKAEVPFDARDFVAHMTLARAALDGRACDCDIAWRIEDYELLRSQTGTGGPVYERVSIWPLMEA